MGSWGAELESRGAAAPVNSPRTRGPPARRGGAGRPGRRPLNPTPTAAACSRGHRPQAAGPARGRREMRRRCRVPSSAARAIGEIKVCSMRLVCSASHIRRATSCSTRAHRTNEKKKKKKLLKPVGPEADRSASRACMQTSPASRVACRTSRPAWTGPAAPAALTDNLLQLVCVPADGPADRLRGRSRGHGSHRSRRCCRCRRGRRCHRGRLMGLLDVHGRAARLRHDAAGGGREDAPAGGRPST